MQSAHIEVWLKSETQAKGFVNAEGVWVDGAMNGKPQPTYAQICAF